MWKNGHRYINERGQVILAMYWEKDDETHKKQRMIEGQKQKKFGKAKDGTEYEVVSLDDYSQTAEEIKRQNDLIAKQQQDINGLHGLLVNLTKMVENQSNGTTIIYQGTQEEKAFVKEDGMPTLGELDIQVINTEGITTQGEVGQLKTEKSDTQNQVARLRELKSRRGKQNE
jgi:hypothetical protein